MPTVAPVPLRDATDRSAISDVLNFTGDIVDRPAGVAVNKANLAAWLNDSASACPDGIPDPTDGADGARDLDGNGYTELEGWLAASWRRTVP